MRREYYLDGDFDLTLKGRTEIDIVLLVNRRAMGVKTWIVNCSKTDRQTGR
jgi:hypothetical protein